MTTRQLVTELDHLEAIYQLAQEGVALLREIARQGRAQATTPAPARDTAPAPPPTGGGEVADDADLDSQYGNPTVRKDPPRWTGQSCAGMAFSDCPADYLESLAGFLDWCAAKSDEKNEMANNGKPRSSYLRRDAARARGWARRQGKPRGVARTAAAPGPVPGFDTDDDVPF